VLSTQLLDHLNGAVAEFVPGGLVECPLSR
jgi:hypothetical protein